MLRYDVAVIGAGPAGMMAAIRAGQLNSRIVLLERNERPGKKLLLSGKGRCNLTNNRDYHIFIKHFGKNGLFLRDAFNKLFNQDLINFFENKGLKLKTERGNRVFPQDDRASSVLNVLKRYLDEAKVKIIFNARATGIFKKDKDCEVRLENGNIIKVKRVILATGGSSYPLTGSTGDGFKLAADLGHRIVPLRPGLVPFEVKELWVKNLAGLSLKNIRVKIFQARKSIESQIGEMLFTHWGVSGPLILDLSNKAADWLEIGPVILSIDFKPGLNQHELEARLLRDFKLQGAKNFKNILNGLLPKKIINVFIETLGIDANKKGNQVMKQERSALLNLLKSFRLSLTKARPLAEAIITRGGVSLKEINPKTMESRLIRNLYFAGEIIDVDADTGGFNLQAAFSTGYLAGESAANSL